MLSVATVLSPFGHYVKLPGTSWGGKTLTRVMTIMVTMAISLIDNARELRKDARDYHRQNSYHNFQEQKKRNISLFLSLSFSPLRLKKQRELVHVELVLRVHNLHRQAPLPDLVLTDAQNAVLFLTLQANEQTAREWRSETREDRLYCQIKTHVCSRLQNRRLVHTAGVVVRGPSKPRRNAASDFVLGA